MFGDYCSGDRKNQNTVNNNEPMNHPMVNPKQSLTTGGGHQTTKGPHLSHNSNDALKYWGRYRYTPKGPQKMPE